MEDALFTRLSGYVGLTALINTRIYPMILPQGVTYPALAYQRISTYPRTGCFGVDDGLARATVQLTTWGDTFASVKAVANQVRQALQRWTTTGIQGTYIIGEFDLYDEEAEKFGAAIDIEIVYEE
jgi:hypothetical protein